MAYFNWNDGLSVGVDTFDAHHKKLVDLINGLHEAMGEGKGRDKVGSILKELARYTVYHFSEEENRMKLHGYPGYQHHKDEHERFVAKVTGFIEKLNDGNLSLSISVMNFLRDWLTSHIQKTDKQYSSFFSTKLAV